MREEGHTRRAVFLDRDGTLNQEVEYLHRIEDFRWIPGATEAIRRLNEADLLVIVVTNQAGVARGYYPEDAVGELHDHMQEELRLQGAHVDAFYYSPYHVEGTVAEFARHSDCRKPGIGMFEQAVAEWAIDATRSFAMGDKNSDIEPARQLGMTTFLVETGYGAAERSETQADRVVLDVAAAVDEILKA